MQKRVLLLCLFVILGLFALTPALKAGGMIEESVKSEVEDELKKAGILGCIVDINVRIDVPTSENPYLELSKYSEDEVAASLWALVLRPKRTLTEGPQPTILMTTAYSRMFLSILVIPLVSYGYNVVVVDMRGTGTSEGHWNTMGLIESYDVKYIIDRWIPSQSWSDGTVGMVGPSYMGILQMLVAGIVDCDSKGEPIHFKASIAQVPYSDVYADIVMHGGNFDLEFITFWILLTEGINAMPGLTLLGENAQLPYPVMTTTMEDYEEAVAEFQASVDSFLEPFYDLVFLASNDMRNETLLQKSPIIYWPDKPAGGWDVGVRNEGERVYPSKLPTIITGGWFDIFTRGCLNQYTYGLKNHAIGDKALIVGDWYHIDASMALGLNSFMTGAFYARWFDWKMRGNDDCYFTEYPVMIKVMGINRWRGEKTWPLPASRVEKKSLHLSKKKAEPIPGDEFTNKDTNQILSLEWNRSNCDLTSENPVMKHTAMLGDFHGENSRSFTRWLMGIPALVSQISKFFLNSDIDSTMEFENDSDDDWRIPTFTTAPLDKDVEIVGPVSLRFWARTDFRDRLYTDAMVEDFIVQMLGTLFNVDVSEGVIQRAAYDKEVQFVIELDDVFEDGRARNITSGWLRSSHRQRDDNESWFATEHAVDPNYKPFDPFYMEPDEDPELIKEGELYEYVVELWPTCNVFKKGHRIRVTMTGSDWPHLMPVFVPSYNEIVIDENHEARLDFTTTNTNNEGVTWKWITESSLTNNAFDKYLLSHRDTPAAAVTEPEPGSDDDDDTGSGTEASVNDTDSGIGALLFPNSDAGGCGTAANASAYRNGETPMLPGLLSTLAMMLVPLAMTMAHRRWRRRKK